jgi:hypothetical protein
VSPVWFEKLGLWEDALKTYASRSDAESRELSNMLGRARCLEALGRYDELQQWLDGAWVGFNTAERAAFGKVACSVALGSASFAGLEQILGDMFDFEFDRHFV